MSPLRAVRRFNLFTWLRNSFLAGVAVVLPFVVTIWVIWLVVSIIDHNVAPLIPATLKPFTSSFFGSGVIIAVAVLTLIGALAGNLVGRWLVDATDQVIGNLPLVRSISGVSRTKSKGAMPRPLPGKRCCKGRTAAVIVGWNESLLSGSRRRPSGTPS